MKVLLPLFHLVMNRASGTSMPLSIIANRDPLYQIAGAISTTIKSGRTSEYAKRASRAPKLAAARETRRLEHAAVGRGRKTKIVRDCCPAAIASATLVPALPPRQGTSGRPRDPTSSLTSRRELLGSGDGRM